MEPLFVYLFKSSGLLVLFYFSYYLLLRKETFFTTNRWFLIVGLCTAVILPLLFYTKIILVEPSVRIIDWTKIPITTINETAVFTINWYLIFAIIYGIGFLLLILRFAFEFYSLKNIFKNKTIQKQADFKFIDTTDNIAPFSYFNTIVYNSSLYNPTELKNIIEHEKIHCEQKHTVDVLISRLFCIVFWFNPFIWFYKKAILQNLEFIADHEATKKIADKKAYQITLLKITTHENCVSLTNHFYQSLIKKRIVMLNKNQSKKRNSWKYAVVTPALIAFVILFQIRVVAQEKDNPKLENLKTSNTDEQLEIQLEAQITEKSTDLDLDRIINLFKTELGTEVKIKKIKRNSQNEITSIKVTATDGKSYKTVHEISQDKPILPFIIKVVKDKDNKIEVFISSSTNLTDTKAKLPNSKNTDNNSLSLNSMKINRKELLIVINNEIQGRGNAINIPLDEEIDIIKTLNSKDAIIKYGLAGENGAYEITTKDENFVTSTVATTAKTPKTFSFTQNKSTTDTLSIKRNAKLKTNQRDLNLEKTDPTNLNNKQVSKTTTKIVYVKATSNKPSVEEAEIYINGVKSSKSELDKISPNSIQKMEVIKSDEDKKIIKITTKKQ